MKKSNSKQKALGAFKKLGAVALMVATMFFTACNQAGGGGNTDGGGEGGKPTPTPTPKPKHAITFNVDGGTGGKLTAIVDGNEINSGSEVEEGKAITFVATPETTYRVKEWKVDDASIEGNKLNIYTHTVAKAVTVKVSFEEIPKHEVNFSVEGGNGKLKAKVSEAEINSGKKVEEGKTVTFTATANDGYRVKGWVLDGNAVNGTAETYTLAVTQPATVKMSFEVTSVEGGAVLILSPDHLTISVEAKTADGSDIAVEGCEETTLKSDEWTNLHAKGTKVILKGKITELTCGNNKLTSLNVQGLTSLQWLDCGNRGSRGYLTELNVQGCTALKYMWFHSNQLNAQAMTEILKALPAREASDDAKAILYTEETGKTEGNHKDYTQPAELKAAFDGAKSRNWKLKKINVYGNWKDI